MTSTVFIDGQEGTTGLQIHERLRARTDLRLLEIAPEQRKDPEAKRALMRQADVAILCLPDAAAAQAAALADAGTRLLDASTAHRVAPGWVYGLPELAPEQREQIRDAARVSNPGCYPTGFLLALRPLVDAGVVASDHPVCVHAQSGYSGAGKKLIKAFSQHDLAADGGAWTARPYGLSLRHKHVPEMQRHARLDQPPVFSPLVGGYYQGMLVNIPLHVRTLARPVSPQQVHELLSRRYEAERFVRVMPLAGGDALEDGYLSPTACNASNRVELFVFGHSEQLLLCARLDNLGKGAAGAAVQNLNLMIGADEACGLDEAGPRVGS